MKNIIKITMLVILVAFIVHQIWSNTITNATETPEYTVLESYETIEIREYPELIMATTVMGTSDGERSGNGFRTVAGYIFGGNETNEKISMTAPVVFEMADTLTMSFIMPSEYTMESLPAPDNSEVTIHTEQSKIVAVIQYSGFSNDQKLEEYSLQLKEALDKNNLTSIGPYMYYGYNPPYQMTNRLNEIAVEVVWNSYEK